MPTLDDIEVTPEMVKAGVDAYYGCSLLVAEVEDRVIAVYEAMRLARLASSQRES